MPSLYDTAKHEKMISAIVKAAERYDHILLIWLEGAFARGNADRYSEIDLHIALDDDDFDLFTSARISLANELGKVIYILEENLALPTLIILYDSGIVLQMVLEKISQVNSRARQVVRVIMDKDDYSEELDVVQRESTPDEINKGKTIRVIGDFWFRVSSFPMAVKRDIPLSLCQCKEADLRRNLVELMALSRDPLGFGQTRDPWNLRLGDNEIMDLESTANRGVTLDDLWKTLCIICHLFSFYGRKCCTSLRLRYPEELETVVKAYIARELEDLLPMDEWLKGW